MGVQATHHACADQSDVDGHGHYNTQQVATVLVTGAGGVAARNFIRSLRLADESLTIIGTDSRPEQLQVSDVDRRRVVPRSDDPQWAQSLERLVQEHRVDAIHAQPDVEVKALAAARDARTITAAMLLPDTTTIARCQDKLACAERLTEAEVAVPASAPLDETSVAAIAKLGGGTAWVRARSGAGSRAALPVQTSAQAAAWAHWWEAMRGVPADEFMVCEYLPGREYAFQSLWFDGELVTSAARERVEHLFASQMPSGQSSTPSLAVSVHEQPVNETAIAAVRAVDSKPHGVYCVDLRCRADGTPCVTEINAGRFFTTSDFFAEAGANMPYAWLALTLGHDAPALDAVDAVPAGLWWVRAVDSAPTLVRNATWGRAGAQAGALHV
jgi:carbamoyl-phosphate synthase large subunit